MISIKALISITLTIYKKLGYPIFVTKLNMREQKKQLSKHILLYIITRTLTQGLEQWVSY